MAMSRRSEFMRWIPRVISFDDLLDVHLRSSGLLPELPPTWHSTRGCQETPRVLHPLSSTTCTSAVLQFLDSLRPELALGAP